MASFRQVEQQPSSQSKRRTAMRPRKRQSCGWYRSRGWASMQPMACLWWTLNFKPWPQRATLCSLCSISQVATQDSLVCESERRMPWDSSDDSNGDNILQALTTGNETGELVDGAPKYRFLRHQGLRPSRKLPDALIIGVKKGGTRALLEFIRLHPDVRAAGNEVHFFDRFYHKGFRWYRQRMPPTLEGQVTMEKTPSYFVTKDVPQKVHRMNPSTKLLVVVRDPVTRAISDYTQVSSKKLGMAHFEQLAFLNGTGGSGLVDTSWGPIKIGVYARHLERWLQCFPIRQMLFVSGERLIVDPAAEMARVQDFLGLKRVITEKHFYFNSTKGFPCLMKSEGRSSPHCLGKTKGRNHPFIDPAAIQRLREFYRPFNARFYQLTGINFGWQ